MSVADQSRWPAGTHWAGETGSGFRIKLMYIPVNKGNMAADALTPCVVRSSAGMMMTE